MDIKILDDLMEIAWELDDIERDTMVRSLKKSVIDKKRFFQRR